MFYNVPGHTVESVLSRGTCAAGSKQGGGKSEGGEEERSDHPSVLEWAFACIRSRAFRISADAHALVPFLDIANHADRPNADFAFDTTDEAVVLAAVEAVKAGQEVTISYTGESGATNQRLLVQYGFVQAGNEGDRLHLGLVAGALPNHPLQGPPCAAHLSFASFYYLGLITWFGQDLDHLFLPGLLTLV